MYQVQMWGGVSQEGTENQVFKLLHLQENLWLKALLNALLIFKIVLYFYVFLFAIKNIQKR